MTTSHLSRLAPGAEGCRLEGATNSPESGGSELRFASGSIALSDSFPVARAAVIKRSSTTRRQAGAEALDNPTPVFCQTED